MSPEMRQESTELDHGLGQLRDLDLLPSREWIGAYEDLPASPITPALRSNRTSSSPTVEAQSQGQTHPQSGAM